MTNLQTLKYGDEIIIEGKRYVINKTISRSSVIYPPTERATLVLLNKPEKYYALR